MAAFDPNSELLLGVDTGGTFTDAVLLDASDHAVVRSAKALTTHDDLAVGVSNALAGVMDDVDPDAVRLVSISTTLATNAVVEGRGSPVLVLLVGFDEQMTLRTGIASAFTDAVIAQVEGGHDHYGNELTPLDVEAVDEILETHGASATAVAVASTFAVRNPSHEEAIRDRVLALTELPVTVSSSLSDSLDAPRRALTASLNARLLARVSNLIAAVETSVGALGISAPVLVAKGDGSLAVASAVARRPIETVLSGPAASIVGAATLSALDDFVLTDVGGTTTDVGQLVRGRPRLVSDGARVGGWRTMVEAIDVRTTGLGGDSALVTDKEAIVLGPTRRVPLSLLATRDPGVVEALGRQLADPPPRDVAGVFVIGPASGSAAHEPRSDIERRIVGRVDDHRVQNGIEALLLADVAVGAVQRRALDQLVARGVLTLAGFTPSDAAHVLGLQDTWSREAAVAGAELYGWYTGEDGTTFAKRVRSEMARRSAGCVLEVALEGEVGSGHIGSVWDNPILAAAMSGESRIGSVDVSMTTATPLVAVGGPAGVFYPEVAERIGAQLVLPEDFAVANAVGAAAGSVVARARAEVQADGPAAFRIVSSRGSTKASDPDVAIVDAIAAARAIAASTLRERSEGLGELDAPSEIVDIDRHDDPNAAPGEGLYGARIHLELRARPANRPRE